MNLSRRAAAVAAVLSTCAYLPAQDTRARVQGLVSDSTQAVVSGATVTLRNNNTGVQVQQATNPAGKYLFDYVLPGAYTVAVEMAGFKKFVQQNVLVQARGDVTVDALPGREFAGEVYAIDPLVDAGGRSIVIRARIANPGDELRPGLFARVSLVVDEKLEAVFDDVVRRNPAEPEFHQAAREVLESLGPVLGKRMLSAQKAPRRPGRSCLRCFARRRMPQCGARFSTGLREHLTNLF